MDGWVGSGEVDESAVCRGVCVGKVVLESEKKGLNGIVCLRSRFRAKLILRE